MHYAQHGAVLLEDGCPRGMQSLLGRLPLADQLAVRGEDLSIGSSSQAEEAEVRVQNTHVGLRALEPAQQALGSALPREEVRPDLTVHGQRLDGAVRDGESADSAGQEEGADCPGYTTEGRNEPAAEPVPQRLRRRQLPEGVHRE